MTDALADIRKTEQTIRQTEVEVQQERAELRRKVDTAAADDRRDTLRRWLRAAVPKPTSATIKDRIRDIEQRILPGCDESLWLLADDVVLEIEPDVDPQVLRKNMRRWQPPDPGHKDRPSPTHHMEYRPADIVDWVLGKIAAVERSEANRADESERAARKREAERRVNAAQAEYNRVAAASARRGGCEGNPRRPDARAGLAAARAVAGLRPEDVP